MLSYCVLIIACDLCSLKFHIDEESHDSGVLLEPIQIIEALSSAGGLQYGHPTNQLLYESCHGQQKECGCGVTTLVCLSAFWSEGVIRLVEEVNKHCNHADTRGLPHDKGRPKCEGAWFRRFKEPH